MPRFLTTFTVTGLEGFPVDMLRYDEAYPANAAAVAVIAPVTAYHGSLFCGSADPSAPPPVRSGRFATNKNMGPTVARWESFGWAVSEVNVHAA